MTTLILIDEKTGVRWEYQIPKSGFEVAKEKRWQ